MFLVFKVDSIHFACFAGTKLEKYYRSFTSQTGGKVVGTKHRSTMDVTNTYRDEVMFEILREDFLNKMTAIKRLII